MYAEIGERVRGNREAGFFEQFSGSGGGQGFPRKLWPHSSSVIALTLRVETPCTYISASAATSARSDR